MSVTCETFQEDMSPLKDTVWANIRDMSVTCETFQDEILPLKELALVNIRDMSVTRERSGASAALYTMFRAFWKASCMDDHCISPHWSMETSLSALAVLSPSLIRVKSPDMRTVCSPGEAYVCVWSPVTLNDIVPSPQSILYAPAAPPTGMIMDSFGDTVLQVVTKAPGGRGVSDIVTVMLSEAAVLRESVAVRVRVIVVFCNTSGAVKDVVGDVISCSGITGWAGCCVHCTVMVSSGSMSEAVPFRVIWPPSNITRSGPADTTGGILGGSSTCIGIIWRLLSPKRPVPPAVIFTIYGFCMGRSGVFMTSVVPFILNRGELPPVPIPYVGEWPSRKVFCADMVPTVPGVSW